MITALTLWILDKLELFDEDNFFSMVIGIGSLSLAVGLDFSLIHLIGRL